MSTVVVEQSVKSFNYFTSFAVLKPALNWTTQIPSSHNSVFSSAGGVPIKRKGRASATKYFMLIF